MAKGTEGISLLDRPPPAEETLVAIRELLQRLTVELSREFAELQPRLESIDGRLASIDEKLGRLDNLGKLDVIAHQLSILVQYAASSKPS